MNAHLSPSAGELTIVVGSCNRYSDLLEPFSKLWRQYWPDCPYELVLATESTPPNAANLAFDRILTIGTGKSWSRLMQEALREIQTPYLIYLCDDYFLSAPVPTRDIARHLELCRRHRAVNLRLLPNPPPTQTFAPEPELGLYEKNTAYCIATQAGIWDRDFFLRLVRGCESIWEFERLGSFACADEPRPLLCTKRQILPFVDAVHKGCWEPFGLKVLREAGITPDFTRRQPPTRTRRFIEWGKGVIFRLNPTWVVRIQNRFGLGKK